MTELTIQEREAMLIAALSDAVHFIKTRHNMGRQQREDRRLSILRNAQEVLTSCEYSGENK